MRLAAVAARLLSLPPTKRWRREVGALRPEVVAPPAKELVGLEGKWEDEGGTPRFSREIKNKLLATLLNKTIIAGERALPAAEAETAAVAARLPAEPRQWFPVTRPVNLFCFQEAACL